MNAIIGTGKISKRQYELIAERNVSVTMSDGVEIDVDIFRPASDEKFPALLAMSAFNKEVQSARIWPAASRSRRIRGMADADIEAGPIDFFVRRGYVYVVGSVRGTGRSGGAYRYRCPRECRDLYELIEWAAEQPWCSGNVGMQGIGYFVAHQIDVATMQPPHLKAIAPISSFFDNYRYFWWKGGILASGFARWLISMVNIDVHTQESVLKEELGEEGYRDAIARALADKDLCADPAVVEALKNPDVPTNAAFLDIVLHPTYGKFWQDRATEDFDKVKIPVYHASSEHRPGVLYHWPEFQTPQKLFSFPKPYSDRPYYQAAWEVLRWYDYWLKGIDTGIMDEPKVKIFVEGSNEWLMAEDYPIPGTRWIPFNLHENHSLCEIEPWPDAASASYDDAPGNRGSLEYKSAPLVENTEVVGPIVLNLYASCRGTDMNFFVGLWDEHPDGKKVCLTRGWLKASHREVDPERSKPYHPVHTFSNPQPLVPGRVYELNIPLFPTANLFKAGHRIVLRISSADDEPEKLSEVRMFHIVSQTPNTITVYHDARYPSHLLLPITKGNIVGTYVSGGDISLESKEFMKQD